MLEVQYMESLGNDFVVIDGVTQFFEPSSKEISKVLNFDHDFSIDQIMLILPPSNSKFDLFSFFELIGIKPKNPHITLLPLKNSPNHHDTLLS